MENETATQRGSGAQIVVLVPAHQEAASIASVLGAVLAQERPADRVVVAANGCTDETAEVARSFGSSVTVIDLPRLQHRKSEALNLAWSEYADDADLVVCLDGDTVLPPNALGDWEKEFSARERLGGSSAKFTIQAGGFLPRMQKAEYSVGIDNALRRGSTTVLPGAGVMFRGSVLRTIADRPDREGPWSYESATEDFELTYRIREAGWHCGVSGDVRAYTDSMRTVRALWGQRLKWQGGTLEDLFRFGLNRLTLRDWVAQGAGMLNVVTRLLWLTMISLALVLDVFEFSMFWVAISVGAAALGLVRANRIPHRDWKDLVLAGMLWPGELFAWLSAGWFLASWTSAVWQKITGKTTDLWAAQARAEGN